MNEVTCDVCKKYFNLDKDNNKNEKYIQCPNCGKFLENIFYKNDTN